MVYARSANENDVSAAVDIHAKSGASVIDRIVGNTILDERLPVVTKSTVKAIGIQKSGDNGARTAGQEIAAPSDCDDFSIAQFFELADNKSRRNQPVPISKLKVQIAGRNLLCRRQTQFEYAD